MAATSTGEEKKQRIGNDRWWLVEDRRHINCESESRRRGHRNLVAIRPQRRDNRVFEQRRCEPTRFHLPEKLPSSLHLQVLRSNYILLQSGRDIFSKKASRQVHPEACRDNVVAPCEVREGGVRSRREGVSYRQCQVSSICTGRVRRWRHHQLLLDMRYVRGIVNISVVVCSSLLLRMGTER